MRAVLFSLFLCFSLQSFGATLLISSNSLVALPSEAPYKGGINIRPGDGETVSLNPPIFSWFQFTNINTIAYTVTTYWEYQFQISATTSFASPVFSTRTKSNMENRLAPLVAGNTYYWRIGYIPSGDASTNYYFTNSFTIAADATSWDRSMLADAAYLSSKDVHPRVLITTTNRAAMATFAATNNLNDYPTFITRKNSALAAAYWTDSAPWATNGPTSGPPGMNPNVGNYSLGIGSVLTYWAMNQDSSLTNGLVANWERLVDWYLAAHYEFLDYGSGGDEPWVLHCLTLGYDWLYPILSAPQKAKAVQALQQTARFYNRNAFWSAIANSGHWEYDSTAYAGSYTGTRLMVWYNSSRMGTSHQWIDSSTANIIAAAAYGEGGDLREFYDLWVNYMIARGHFAGGWAAMNQGRGYTSVGVARGGLLWNLIAWDSTFPEATFRNIPWASGSGFADWFSCLTPPGYRGGHGQWSDGADNITPTFTTYWNNQYFLNYSMWTGSGNAWQARQNEIAINGSSSGENYFYQFPATYHVYPPPTATTNTSFHVYPEDGWVMANRVYGVNDINAFTNDLWFTFCARPSGPQGGHALPSDGTVEIGAYGAKATDPGAYNLDPYGYRPEAQDCIFVNGQGPKTTEFQGGINSAEQVAPYYARIAAYTNSSDFAYVRGDMTYCFANSWNPEANNVLIWTRDVLMSRAGGFIVIFDHVGTRTNANFDWTWHVRENTVDNLTASGFTYTTTNQYSTAVVITNYLAFMTSGLTYSNTTGTNVLKNVRTGVGWSDGGDPYRRANVLWYRPTSTSTNQYFMAVIVPQKPGTAHPIITPISDLTATVDYNGVTQTVSWDPDYVGADILVNLDSGSSPAPPDTAGATTITGTVISGNLTIQ